MIGYMYNKGRGVSKDSAEAFKWYLKAAEQGNAAAQYALGLLYEQGKGTAKDKQIAATWYRKAAEQGNENAKKALTRLKC
jgi:hypothetical protein